MTIRMPQGGKLPFVSVQSLLCSLLTPRICELIPKSPRDRWLGLLSKKLIGPIGCTEGLRNCRTSALQKISYLCCIVGKRMREREREKERERERERLRAIRSNDLRIETFK